MLSCPPQAFIGSHAHETVAQASDLEGERFGAFRALARKHGLWLSCGGFHEKAGPTTTGDAEEDSPKVCNAHVVVDDAGDIREVYRKMHLFDVSIPGGAVLMESRTTRAGPARAVVIPTPVGRVGLTTCYDLRFPELYVALAQRGAEIILVPSAFTVPTGRAHWHLLLRARAVETQCYVAAPAQVGRHNAKRASFGHALAVDPWGDVLVDAGPEASPEIVCFDVDVEKLRDIRTKMPLMNHRRGDVLDLLRGGANDDDDDLQQNNNGESGKNGGQE
mmetsp:Transcript_12505/g.50268  ORF Transcript_12505/g.50268 Transcript_12505/m.50268 type:complete len:276 (-) Transcript_12505:229-1056(-)